MIKKQPENLFIELKNAIGSERKIINELNILLEQLKTSKRASEKQMISSQIEALEKSLKTTNKEISEITKKINLAKPLAPKVVGKIPIKETPAYVPQIVPPTPISPVPLKKAKKGSTRRLQKHLKFGKIERQIIKKIHKKEKKVVKKKTKKVSSYVRFTHKVFSKKADKLSNKKMFKILERDLVKYNSPLILPLYISMLLFTTLIAFFVGIFLFAFFLFFNVGATFPFITLMQESILSRLVKVIWIIPLAPIATFFAVYLYPSLEKKSAERKINQELPFATIHMAAISGSMLNPTDIFRIIIETKEYPYLQKEFTKLINEVNVYGYNLVVALKNTAFNSPSLKLTELLNGLATTINTGGDLPRFFEKRSQTLLFEHRLEREKYTKSAETFMDIYISVVIAAPMILMLLMMMMKISGIGVSLSTGMITLVLVLGVTIINIVFLTFLHLKQPAG